MSDTQTHRTAASGVRDAILIAIVQVGGALLLTLARKQGMIDAETAQRGTMVLIGMGIAVIGNRMPKMAGIPPAHSLTLAALQQSVHRVGGWAMMLGGVGYAVLWALAPRDVAQVGGTVAALGGVAVMLGHFAWRVLAYHRSSPL